MFSLLELFFSCCIIVAVAKKTYWKRRPLSRLIGAVLDINYVKLPFEKDLVRSGGVLLVRANVLSSRSFIWPVMFDLELECTVGVGGGGRARRCLPEEVLEEPV